MKAKSEALRKAREKETDNLCSCGKSASHPVHKDKEHPKHHKMNAEEKEEKEVEKEESKEGKEGKDEF